MDEILRENREVPVGSPSTSQQKLEEYLEKRKSHPLPKITPETIKRFEKLTLNKNCFIWVNKEKLLHFDPS